MKLRNRFLMLASVACLAGSVACNAAPPEIPKTAKVSAGIVLHAPSSKTTKAKHGVTRWHSIVEKATGAVVIDGQDAKGNVKFITSMRLNPKDGHLHIDAYAPIKGTLIIDTKTGGIVANSLPGTGAWAEMATAMGHDWKTYQQNAAYGFWTNVAFVGGLAIAAVAIVAAAPAIGAAVGAIALITTVAEVGAGVALAVGALAPATGALVTAAAGVAVAVAAKMAADETDKDVAALTERVAALEAAKPAEPAATPPAEPATPPADPAAPPADPATPPADPATPPADPATPPADPATPAADPPAETTTPDAPASPEPAQGQDLPDTNGGGNLDNVDPGGGGGATGGDTTGGSGDTTGGSGGDTTGGSGGDTGGSGGDTGGSAEAVGICRRVAISKLTKVRACTHY